MKNSFLGLISVAFDRANILSFDKFIPFLIPLFFPGQLSKLYDFFKSSFSTDSGWANESAITVKNVIKIIKLKLFLKMNISKSPINLDES